MRVKTSPKKVELAMFGVPFCKINSSTPESPIASPLPLRNVIFSFRISAAKIKANIGLVESYMDELIGVVRSSPTRKSVWLITTPNKENAKSSNRSLYLTRSFGIKRLVIQNSTKAAILLSATRANGLIESGITDLAME